MKNRPITATQRRLTIQYASLAYKASLRVAIALRDKDRARATLHHGTDGFVRDLIPAKLGAPFLRKEIKKLGGVPVA